MIDICNDPSQPQPAHRFPQSLTVCATRTLSRRRHGIRRRSRRRSTGRDNTIRPRCGTRPLVVEEEATDTVRRTGGGRTVGCRLNLSLGEDAARGESEGGGGEEGETHVAEVAKGDRPGPRGWLTRGEGYLYLDPLRARRPGTVRRQKKVNPTPIDGCMGCHPEPSTVMTSLGDIKVKQFPCGSKYRNTILLFCFFALGGVGL